MLDIEVTTWGITFNTAPLYFNLSWGFTIVLIGAIIARKIVKARNK